MAHPTYGPLFIQFGGIARYNIDIEEDKGLHFTKAKMGMGLHVS